MKDKKIKYTGVEGKKKHNDKYLQSIENRPYDYNECVICYDDEGPFNCTPDKEYLICIPCYKKYVLSKTINPFILNSLC